MPIFLYLQLPFELRMFRENSCRLGRTRMLCSPMQRRVLLWKSCLFTFYFIQKNVIIDLMIIYSSFFKPVSTESTNVAEFCPSSCKIQVQLGLRVAWSPDMTWKFEISFILNLHRDFNFFRHQTSSSIWDLYYLCNFPSGGGNSNLLESQIWK